MRPEMKARITDADMAYLHHFPDAERSTVLKRIMARKPAESVVLEGENDFEKTILKLRRASTTVLIGRF